MQPWTLVAIGCLLAGAASLLVGEQALAEARDLAAFYWLATGAISLRASLAVAKKRSS
jgi:hypothetical protein